MATNSFSWQRNKPYLIGLFVSLWVIGLIFSFIRYPSVGPTYTQLKIMKSDMNTLIKNGGKVIYQDGNSKYENAFLLAAFSEEYWSSELRKKDEKTFENLGWQKFPQQEGAFCKNGVLAQIYGDMYKGQGAIFIHMVYSSITVKKCNQTS